MGFLDQVTKGKVAEPIFGITYGDEGVGKTTLGAGLPGVIFAGPEAAKRFDVARLPEPKSYSDLYAQLVELRDLPHSFKSFCLDSLDWTDMLMMDEIKEKQKEKSIEDCFGGYGKWVNGIVAAHKKLIDLVLELRNKRGMHIMIICHYQVKKFDNPMTQLPYDRYMLKLCHEKVSALWREAVDFVFFATYDVKSYSSDKNAKKGRGLEGEARVVYTEKRASHDAKNRLGLPYRMPLDIVEILRKINETDADQLLTMQKDFEAMLLDITDKDLLEKANTTYLKVKGNLDLLRTTMNRLKAALGQTVEG